MTTVLSGLVVIGQLLLAAVFAVAGVAKLADRKGTRTTLVGFGTPQSLAGPLAVALPIAELVVAGALLPASTATYGAIGAVALIVTFSAAIAWNLAHGRSPDCHCFGQLHSAPAGRRALVRNGALAVLALAVLLAGLDDRDPGVLAWTRGMDGVEWLALGLAVALAVLAGAAGYAVVHVLRGYGWVLVRLERVEARLREAGLELGETPPELGLPPGAAAPAFWLPSTEGDRVALEDLLAPGHPVLLLFTSPTCGPCSLLMPEVARWQREHADTLTVALLSDSEVETARREAVEHGLENVLLDPGRKLYEAYEANGTPSAVLVGDDGRVASWLASGADWIGSLAEQALRGLGRTRGRPLGSEAPRVRLETLDGPVRAIAELAEGTTVVLFWNPTCGFCREMRGALLEWEAAPPPGAPTLVIVSTGTVDEVRAEGFVAPTLLDPDWSLATAFGADGTPIAVLLDGGGRVSSALVTGAEAVFGLLAVERTQAA